MTLMDCESTFHVRFRMILYFEPFSAVSQPVWVQIISFSQQVDEKMDIALMR